MQIIPIILALVTLLCGLTLSGGWAHYIAGRTNGGVPLHQILILTLAGFGVATVLLIAVLALRWRSIRTSRRAMAISVFSLGLVLSMLVYDTGSADKYFEGLTTWASKRIDVAQARTWLKSLPPSSFKMTQP